MFHIEDVNLDLQDLLEFLHHKNKQYFKDGILFSSYFKADCRQSLKELRQLCIDCNFDFYAQIFTSQYVEKDVRMFVKSTHSKVMESQKQYSSPKAVFDAYREARLKRDARTFFSLLTPQAQNDEVFETFFSCMERQGTDTITGRHSEAEEIGRIVEKYVDVASLHADYEKKYKEKHGIDIAKVTAGHENDQTFVPPPHDDQLWRDVVASHVKDKAGFYEAVAKSFEDRAAKQHEENPVMPLGDLENLVVHEDTATGSVKETILRSGGESSRKPEEEPPVYDRPLKFQRINGGWLIDMP
jgi:hypothetical protein